MSENTVTRAGEGQLDGTIASVAREINRLHGEIESALRTSVDKAIRVGGLLYRVRASRKGKWLAWLKASVPFDQKTAWWYMKCYENRELLKLGNIPNLAAARKLLYPPKHEPSELTDEAPTLGATIVDDTLTMLRRRHKTARGAIAEIQPGKLNPRLQKAQMAMDQLFAERIAQIRRMSHAGWPDFPDRLIVHGKALIEQGERLSAITQARVT